MRRVSLSVGSPPFGKTRFLPVAQFGAGAENGGDDQLRFVAEVIADQRWIDAGSPGNIQPGNLCRRHHLHQLAGRRDQSLASDGRRVLLGPALLPFCAPRGRTSRHGCARFRNQRKALSETRCGRNANGCAYPPPCREGRLPERSEGERGGGRCLAYRQTTTPTPALRADPPHKGEGKALPHRGVQQLDYSLIREYQRSIKY